ncbi:MAG TPA: isochorismate synthase [Acidimicrobiia bacterium]|jgi:menaquinone-specific isochorismate synthase
MTLRARELSRIPSDLLDRRPGVVWWSPTIKLLGFGALHRLEVGRGPARFEQARLGFQRWQEDTGVEAGDDLAPVAFASFSFDNDSADSVLLIPQLTLVIEGERAYTVSTEDADPAVPDISPTRLGADGDRPRFAGSSLPDHLWLIAVARVLEEIAQGHVEKVVLARDHALWSKRPFDPHHILERLRSRFPGCYLYLVDGMVGASPELLIRRRGLDVASCPLAGSIGRSEDPEEDARLAKVLLTSEKDQREHALAAASVGRVLGQVCRSLNRTGTPEILQLANVQHLATAFSGTLAEPAHVLDLVARLHPTAAVAGEPTVAALALLTELESMQRGRYAGPVGYFDADGNGEFAIALRCAELSGARARLFAGAGLVEGSVPEDELEETRLKLQAMLSALD